MGKPEIPQRLPLMFIEPEAYFSGTPPSVTHTHTHLLTLEPSAVHSLPHTLPGRAPCKCWLRGLALSPLNQDL